MLLAACHLLVNYQFSATSLPVPCQFPACSLPVLCLFSATNSILYDAAAPVGGKYYFRTYSCPESLSQSGKILANGKLKSEFLPM